MDKMLQNLVGRLEKTFGPSLVSVILYGSAAGGEHDGRFSDLNVLYVLEEVTSREVARAAPIVRWWRDQGFPGPLLLSREEVATSADCFPIEFYDLKARRRVLHGEDVIGQVELDGRHYRAQVEHELRAKLLRLRQKVAGALVDRKVVLDLLAESVATFTILFRHALRLAGVEAQPARRDVLARAAEVFGIDREPFDTLFDLREGRRKPRQVDPSPLFAAYLDQIGRVIAAVDRLGRPDDGPQQTETGEGALTGEEPPGEDPAGPVEYP
jgi:predicted nucleotidyltransferase